MQILLHFFLSFSGNMAELCSPENWQ